MSRDVYLDQSEPSNQTIRLQHSLVPQINLSTSQDQKAKICKAYPVTQNKAKKDRRETGPDKVQRSLNADILDG